MTSNSWKRVPQLGLDMREIFLIVMMLQEEQERVQERKKYAERELQHFNLDDRSPDRDHWFSEMVYFRERSLEIGRLQDKIKEKVKD